MGTNHSRDFEFEREAFKEKYEANPRADPNINVNDFERSATVGTGTFGRVILVKDKKDKTPYALKGKISHSWDRNILNGHTC